MLEKAAGKGHVGAMFALAALKGGGYDVPVDRPATLRWLREAAERGHGEAQRLLAMKRDATDPHQTSSIRH